MDGSAACKHETLSGQWHLPAEMPDELRTGRSRLGRFALHLIVARFRSEGKPHRHRKSRIFNRLEALLVPDLV